MKRQVWINVTEGREGVAKKFSLFFAYPVPMSSAQSKFPKDAP